MPKDFKTIEEQIEILKKRGLNIKDEKQAEKFLLENNYYRVSGYSLTLRKNDVFYKSAEFQNIIDIYSFDEGFRAALMMSLERAEIKIKSLYAYYFAEKYGALGYIDNNNFSDYEKYSAIMDKVNALKDKNAEHEAFIKHFVDDLGEDMPIWAFIELFTLSDLSKLYAITDSEIRKKVACYFGMLSNNADDTFGKYLRSFSILRNICAHNSRVFNRLFKTKPTLNKTEQQLLRKAPDGKPDNSRVFGFVLELKRVLTEYEYADLKNAIIDLCKKYPFVDMRYYGFCDNWEKKI
jgi:abortive infection bacteriophage resistance protein